MEQHAPERTLRKFDYTPASIFTDQWSNLAFAIGMIVVPMICPFGIRIRRLQLLSPTAFSIILILGGAVLLLFTLASLRNARTLKAAGGTITYDGGRITYPAIRKGKVEYRTFLVSDIERVKDDDEEHQCKVTLPDARIVFETGYFASPEEYEAFRSLLG